MSFRHSFAGAAALASALLFAPLPSHAGPLQPTSPDFRSVQVAQTQQSGLGQINLGLLTDSMSLQRVQEAIVWRIITYGRDENGRRWLVGEYQGPGPRLTLPAGWYIVEAHHSQGMTKHTIDVVANDSLDYVLIRD